MSSYVREFAIHLKANEAGKKAVAALKVEPMYVSDGRTTYYIQDGACGFGWVEVRPGNCRYSNFLKMMEIGSYSNYHRAVMFWCREYGQSVQKKAAYVEAYAKVLRHYGINAWGHSRLD